MKHDYDYIIVGARCAGAGAAMLLARMGAQVLLIDRAPHIGDTLSTHALMRPAVTLLDQWDVLPEITTKTPAVTQTHFHYGPDTISVDVAPFGRSKGLYAPRRNLLDQVVLKAAERAGADVELGVAFEGLATGNKGEVTGAQLRLASGRRITVKSTMLIGADGRTSAVAAHLKAPLQRVSDACTAVTYGYFHGIRNTGYRWYFGNGIAGGTIPTGDNAHCVFLSASRGHMKNLLQADAPGAMARVIGQWDPEVLDAMNTNGPIEKPRRFGGAPGHVKQCSGAGWALVGDAGYFKDPCTGHGISDAFLDAQRLANALYQSPSNAYSYEVARNQMLDGVFNTTQEIAGLEWSMPRLQELHKMFSKAVKLEAQQLEVSLPRAA